MTQQTLKSPCDLPPFWDGLAVVWDGWHTPPPAFICPPPRWDRCSGCGSLTQPVHNRGRVAISSLVTHESIRDADAAKARLPVGVRHKIKHQAFYRLVALRCPDCGHDTVLDLTDPRGGAWELDPSDYSPDGSWEAP